MEAEADDQEDISAADLQLSETPFAIDFHPNSLDVLAVGLVDGVVGIHDVRREEEEAGDENKERVVLKSSKNRGSCRVASWRQPYGDALFAGYESGALVAWDVEARRSKRERALESSTSSCLSLEHMLACGDESGKVYVWDVRTAGDAVLAASVHEDYVSGLEVYDGLLLSSGADGRLSVCDPRRNLASVGKSDPQDDELLSVRVMKNGRKVVCGTQTGALVIWSWGRWGDSSDRALGHPESVDAMLKVDEDVLCTGSSDGLIRVCRIQPGLKLLGVLGDHDTFPVERLAANNDMSMVASISHDHVVRFWDSRELKRVGVASDQPDDEDDSSQLEDRMETEDNDDDAEGWETDDDSDDDDSMMAQQAAASRGRKQQTRLRSVSKKNSESFFDGL